MCASVQHHPCEVLRQLLELSPQEAGPAEKVSDKDEQVKAWNETVSSALAHDKVQSRLSMLGYSAVSCSDLLKIAARACSQLQSGGPTSVPEWGMHVQRTCILIVFSEPCAAGSLLRGAPTSPASAQQLSSAVLEAVENVLESSYPVVGVLSNLSDLQKQLVLVAEQLRDGPYAITFEVRFLHPALSRVDMR
jgi:hypothetical protein